jgi:hypothetical protein
MIVLLVPALIGRHEASDMEHFAGCTLIQPLHENVRKMSGSRDDDGAGYHRRISPRCCKKIADRPVLRGFSACLSSGSALIPI